MQVDGVKKLGDFDPYFHEMLIYKVTDLVQDIGKDLLKDIVFTLEEFWHPSMICIIVIKYEFLYPNTNIKIIVSRLNI